MTSENGQPTKRLQIIAGFLLLILGLVVIAPGALLAHPMGNFSISHFARIRIDAGAIELRYILDLAEIPTFQEIQTTGIVMATNDPKDVAYLAAKAEALKGELVVTLNGRRLLLETVSENMIFSPGAGNLPTMKIGVAYSASIADAACPCRLEYRDGNFPERAGWKEVVATAGPGATLDLSTAAGISRSQDLANYPTDLVNSPPQDVEADVTFSVPGLVSATPKTAGDTGRTIAEHEVSVPAATGVAITAPRLRIERAKHRASAAASAEPTTVARGKASAPLPLPLRANEQSTPRSEFTELVYAPNLNFWFLFTAAFIAAGLGALHALEPGHGKTIVAAYLVGSKGTGKHAVFLGLIVTAAHTAGVYLLGAVTLYASKYIVPEHLYPWLGMISGIIIAVFALYMMLRAWTGENGGHSHEIGTVQSHRFASPGRSRATENDSRSPGDGGTLCGESARKASLRQILTLGITGGMVPCPAALVVLLGAFSLHRVGFGLFLIVAFSLGLASVLIVIGLLMVYARQFIARWGHGGPIMTRWFPVASAGFMLILGLGIAGHALLSTEVGSGFLAQAKLPSFVGIVLLGLFLGMRHSTDPDHVVAVSTIASRERSVRHGALLGVFWGVGHTLTIFLVGSAIILFGLVIPPRVGLSMEFSVALMLVLLGILNLTGVLRWLAERFAPVSHSRTRETANSGIFGNKAKSGFGRIISRYGSYQVFRPLVVGLVHGLAGSAAVALLVLSTIRSPLWAIAYLLVFGFGTIIGMILMTSAMAIPVAYTGRHSKVAGKYLSPISGIVSTAFGLFLVYHIGFVDGLFKAKVHWTPQ
jgi:ABC-type nickel/cobalt efflux system permease component RcnA